MHGRCCYLHCKNQEAFQGYLSYLEGSQSGSIYSEHRQIKVAVPLLGKHPGFFTMQHLFLLLLSCIVKLALEILSTNLGCHREP